MRRRGSDTHRAPSSDNLSDSLSDSVKKLFGKTDRSASTSVLISKKPQSDIYKDCQVILQIKEAKNVPPLDLNGLSDPYCIIFLEKIVLYTKIIWKSLTPFWGESFKIPVGDPDNSVLLIEMWDKDKGKSDDAIGKISFNVKEIKNASKPIIDQWYTLLPIDDGKNKDAVVSGCITFGLTWKNNTLQVLMESGCGLASKDSNGLSDPFVVIEIGSEKKKSAVIRKTLDPVWNESFEFPLPSIENQTIVITVYDWDQFGTDFMGMITLALDKTPLDGTSQTHTLNYKPEYGQIRLSIDYTETLILPYSYYRDVIDVLFDEKDYSLFLLIGKSLSAIGRDQFSEHLIQLTEAEAKTFELITYLTDLEILESESPDVLFRGNSLACKALDHCMKLLGGTYLQETLRSFVKSIYSSSRVTEIDPSKSKGKSMDLKKNLSNLIDFSTQLFTLIFDSASKCPTGLVRIFTHLKETATTKFGTKEVGYRAVSSFIFLRFFCAAILNPRLFDLHTEYPKGKVSRTFTLLAKILQNLAGFVEFGGKEPYMTDINPLIVENFDKMRTFLEKISNFNNTPTISFPESDSALHCAHLLPFFWQNLPQLKESATPEQKASKIRDLEQALTSLNKSYHLFG